MSREQAAKGEKKLYKSIRGLIAANAREIALYLFRHDRPFPHGTSGETRELIKIGSVLVFLASASGDSQGTFESFGGPYNQ